MNKDLSDLSKQIVAYIAKYISSKNDNIISIYNEPLILRTENNQIHLQFTGFTCTNNRCMGKVWGYNSKFNKSELIEFLHRGYFINTNSDYHWYSIGKISFRDTFGIGASVIDDDNFMKSVCSIFDNGV